MRIILSLGPAIKSAVYYQSFTIKEGFFFFPRSWVPGSFSGLSHQPLLGSRRRFRISTLWIHKHTLKNIWCYLCLENRLILISNNQSGPRLRLISWSRSCNNTVHSFKLDFTFIAFIFRGSVSIARSVERLTAEREFAGSIPGTRPILRILK